MSRSGRAAVHAVLSGARHRQPPPGPAAAAGGRGRASARPRLQPRHGQSELEKNFIDKAETPDEMIPKHFILKHLLQTNRSKSIKTSYFL